MSANLCPCGSQKNYTSCCEPFLVGQAKPTTSEQLMRSRYTAFTKKDLDYIAQTTDPQGYSPQDMQANKEWADQVTFTQLEILNSLDEGNKGTVEFKAYFKTQDGAEHVHHELSKFRKKAGTWFFRDGKVVQPKDKPNPVQTK